MLKSASINTITLNEKSVDFQEFQEEYLRVFGCKPAFACSHQAHSRVLEQLMQNLFAEIFKCMAMKHKVRP